MMKTCMKIAYGILVANEAPLVGALRLNVGSGSGWWQSGSGSALRWWQRQTDPDAKEYAFVPQYTLTGFGPAFRTQEDEQFLVLDALLSALCKHTAQGKEKNTTHNWSAVARFQEKNGFRAAAIALLAELIVFRPADFKPFYQELQKGLTLRATGLRVGKDSHLERQVRHALNIYYNKVCWTPSRKASWKANIEEPLRRLYVLENPKAMMDINQATESLQHLERIMRSEGPF